MYGARAGMAGDGNAGISGGSTHSAPSGAQRDPGLPSGYCRLGRVQRLGWIRGEDTDTC